MPNSSDEHKLSKLPYSQRQLIVVQTDEVINKIRTTQKIKKTSGGIDWQMHLSSAAKGLSAGGFYGMATFGTISLAKEAYEAWAKARESGLNILPISHTEALQLNMPLGHPYTGILYVGDPAMPTTYYTAASFHRAVFERKFTEALDLLMSLGASHIEVKHIQGWSREFSSTLSSSIPKFEKELTGSKKESHEEKILFKAEFKNNRSLCLHNNRIWYEHEPTWQKIADGRLNYGMSEFSLGVHYQDDFGVNAGLKLKSVKSGLDMGGNFERHIATTWEISGKFSDPII